MQKLTNIPVKRPFILTIDDNLQLYAYLCEFNIINAYFFIKNAIFVEKNSRIRINIHKFLCDFCKTGIIRNIYMQSIAFL
jgi:hypothetical protein